MLKSFSLRLGASSSGANDSIAGRTQPSQSTVLDFLAALGSIDAKRIYHPFELGLNNNKEAPLAGSGGHAAVQIGRLHDGSVEPEGRLVAVKGPQRTAQLAGAGMNDTILTDKRFTQLTLEIRILGHVRLSKHPNIVNLLGICMDDKFQITSLGLILEYSNLGSMRHFLKQQIEGSCPLATRGRFDLARQVAEALKFLHDYRICHGDVKLENILVFRGEGEAFVAKLSDFGQSVVAMNNTEAVEPMPGTPLYEAPELRRGDNLAGMGIINALQADIFSFGLLFWETLNCGRPYFDKPLLDAGPRAFDETDIEFMERFLDSLPQNKLLDYGEQFLLTLDEDILYRQQVFEVFRGCLQDEPSRRKTMTAIIKSMNVQFLPEITNSNEDLDSWDDLSDRFHHLYWGDKVVTWSGEIYLSSIVESAFGKSAELYKFPWSLQQHILTELQSLAKAPATQRGVRAAAAIAVSECYIFGIGTDYNRNECLSWLATAALEGDRKAGLWYRRVCESFSIDPEQGFNVAPDTQLEDELSQIPADLYLTTRLQKYNSRRLESIKSSFGQEGLGGPWSFGLNFFERTNDHPLHVAALYGDDTFITNTISDHGSEVTGISKLSIDGYSAIHFACVGGHLSTLKLLLEHGGNAAGLSDEDITPLHLAIFFPQHNAHAAVDALVSHGANPNIASETVLWDDLDITLFGPPLLWAVGLRNRILVRALIQYTDHTYKAQALQLALALYFWEIAEDLLNYFEAHGGVDFKIVPVQSTKQPFKHWITHGKDLSMAMHRTVQIYHDHKLFTKAGERWGLERNLCLLLETMRNEADFHLIEALWRTWLSHSPDSDKAPVMMSAFRRSGHNAAWRPTLEMLTDAYSVVELNAPVSQEFNMLHIAVSQDAVVAARILLERGVDINRPTSQLCRTALHLCADFDISSEMWELLLEFNAALDARDLGGLTPFQIAFVGKRPTLDVKKCTAILQHMPTDDTYIELLHTLLMNIVINNNSRFSRDDLHVVLIQGRSQACINLPNETGITLLQRATFFLDLDTVKLLLEAGADVNVGFHGGIEGDEAAHMILPLQIALLRGVTCKYLGGSRSESNIEDESNIKELAYDVARELLSCHQANGGVGLANITPLQVACLLQLPTKVNELIGNTVGVRPRSESATADVLDTPIPWLSQDIGNGVVTAAALLSCDRMVDRTAYAFFGHQNLAKKLALFSKFATLTKSRSSDSQSANIPAMDQGQKIEEKKINVDDQLRCDGDSPLSQVKPASRGRTWKRWVSSLLSNPTRKAEVVPEGDIANRKPESHTASNIIGGYGSQPPLIVAARNDDESVVKELLDHGADVNSKAIGHEEGRTALSFAVQNQNESMVKLLLDYKANVNCSATGGIRNTWTPLSFAVDSGHTGFVKLLLDSGAVVDSVITNIGSGHQTMLSLAAQREHGAIVKLLLNRGADADSKAPGKLHNDRTPLSLAAESGCEAIVKMLLDHGVCIDSKAGGAYEGQTPLAFAAKYGRKVVVELLLDRGADINSKATEPFWEGSTPLIFAAEGGHEAIVKLLLERGADADCKATGGGVGQTALHFAAYRGNETIVAMLLTHRANINCRATSRNLTPLEMARIRGYTGTAQLLLDHQANADLKSTDPCIESSKTCRNEPIGDPRHSEN